MTANNIDEVIDILDKIIKDCIQEQNPLGYFASLYRRVTIEVKDKLGTGYFDNDARMEKLDVIFANRYLQAYFDYQENKKVTQAWETTFLKSKDESLIVLQHLLLGMNAHINLDLGIAAAEISNPENIDSLQNDFNRINDILSSLVNEVQDNLSNIWPILKWILKKLNGSEDLIVDFSMKIARDGAWKFAKEFVLVSDPTRPQAIASRDADILKVAGFITKHGFFVGWLLKIVRWTEVGSVAEKIADFQKINT